MLRICDSCGEIDETPRHMHLNAPGTVPVNVDQVAAVGARADLSDEDRKRIIADIMDTEQILKHFACCAAEGCPDGTCGSN